ncbi:aminotransferase class V-fold PLP-dependent enzyme [Biformimicrobium ophioploci]|uniref:Aminotransferase class V-fold PLP-dependent enzyme n=1 Tax=Biformimicrobium ophioploci TaxID=3036711 RepID=A0ABQ6M199_9GAMM|nr:aminotransferase class V-fold PLP-dependent enzyme [Microbulbifer sp. NKW57]GMG88134.1 aminotransferase class V-fold PLP-dependent enzyme [Microbulbifer sp. NKW57]
MQDLDALLGKIRSSVIGERLPVNTPFGERPLIYADYTASGRGLSFIESFIQNQVLPWYANTHTETSATGRQSTSFREQARMAIRKSVNAGDEHAVIFCGSGATAAINRLIDNLGLRGSSVERFGGTPEQIPEERRPVVFIGPYEHHSNELPWRESIAEVVSIPLNAVGELDKAALEAALLQYDDRPLKIGSFSAASNVTGIRTDVDSITELLRKHGALSFWDYAAAAPYVQIDARGNGDSTCKDALFISPHKFIGGPGTPGLLIVKKSLLREDMPAMPGGGTVSWVSPGSHTYLPPGERREEAGTPGIVESIRAGLVFQLKDRVGAHNIEELEARWLAYALDKWRNNPNIEILGGTELKRVSIISMHILRDGKPLHYGFVVALLNDLFGIQVRGGCSCAGPYGHQLLHLTPAQSAAIEEAVRNGDAILKPGWVRLNFNYFFDEATVDYLVQAIDLIAQHGWRLLPYYQFDTGTGVWRYQGQEASPAVSLDLFNEVTAGRNDMTYSQLLAEAEQLMLDPQGEPCTQPRLSGNGEDLRWFNW